MDGSEGKVDDADEGAVMRRRSDPAAAGERDIMNEWRGGGWRILSPAQPPNSLFPFAGGCAALRGGRSPAGRPAGGNPVASSAFPHQARIHSAASGHFHWRLVPSPRQCPFRQSGKDKPCTALAVNSVQADWTNSSRALNVKTQRHYPQ